MVEHQREASVSPLQRRQPINIITTTERNETKIRKTNESNTSSLNQLFQLTPVDTKPLLDAVVIAAAYIRRRNTVVQRLHLIVIVADRLPNGRIVYFYQLLNFHRHVN